MRSGTYVALACILLPVICSGATWTGGGDGQNWFDGANWDTGTPAAGEDAVINSGDIMLTNATAALGSFTMGGGTLTFSNWDTKLSAANVIIQNGAMLTHITNSALAVNGLGEWPTDGRVWIVCTNFDLHVGGQIDVKGRGFMGSTAIGSNGYGPGMGICGGAHYAGGAGHGGRGGYIPAVNGAAGVMYGLTNAPVLPGSGGGGQLAGAGGGAVRIDAGNGSVTVNGLVDADANDATSNGSGGSGGSIYITCRTFAGSSNGLLSAKGGLNRWGPSSAGSGGRIAVVYDSDAQRLQPAPLARFNVGSRLWSTILYRGDAGTLYLPCSAILTTNLLNFENVRLYGVTNWSVDSLSLTNLPTPDPSRPYSFPRTFEFAEPRFTLTVTNTLKMETAVYKLGSPVTGTEYAEINCGELLLTNGVKLYLYSETNAVTDSIGTRVMARNEFSVATNCWIYPASHGTKGGVVYISSGNMNINAGGGINADSSGYDFGRPGYGPGGGQGGGNYGGGAGHGGSGGTGSAGAGGVAYSWTNAPRLPGSGANAGRAGDGGGLVWIKASGTFVQDGDILANGENGGGVWDAGGSGGGIFLIAHDFQGTGHLSANGGEGGMWNTSTYSGGGGGGRIALWYHVPDFYQQIILSDPDNAQANVPGIIITNNFTESGFMGDCTVSNGWGYASNAVLGTVVCVTVPPSQGTILLSY